MIEFTETTLKDSYGAAARVADVNALWVLCEAMDNEEEEAREEAKEAGGEGSEENQDEKEAAAGTGMEVGNTKRGREGGDGGEEPKAKC